MTLERLFSPWRMEYIQREKKEGCVFCEAIDRQDGTENLIFFRGPTAFVILNRYPYTSGHLMVVPYLHKASLDGLSKEIRSEIIELSTRAMQVLRIAYQPQGFNLGVNVGEAAGAGILDHVHFHIVPRWGGDTNFMSTLGRTRVIPESLEDTYQRVRETWLKTE